MKLLIETNCSNCNEPIEREHYFVGKIKLVCEKCKKARKDAYAKRRYELMSRFFKEAQV